MTAAVSRTEHLHERMTDPALGQPNPGTYQLRLGSRHGVVVAKAGSLRQPQMWQAISRPAPVVEAAPGPVAENKPTDRIHAADFAKLLEAERRTLQTLAALDNAPLSVERLSKLTGINDISAAMTNLQSRGWLQTDQQRCWLAPGLTEKVREAYDLSTLKAWALMHFSRVIKEQLAPASLTDIVEAIAALVSWTVQTERWSDTMRLVLGAEKTLVLSHSWTEWRHLLKQALIAADALGDQSRQGWAWHQLGSLALYQQDLQTARTALHRALQIRQALGETDAAALTRANLNAIPASKNPLPVLTEQVRLPLLAGLILGLVIATSFFIWGGGNSVQARGSQTEAVPLLAQVEVATPTRIPVTRSSQAEVVSVAASEKIAVPTETPLPSPTPCSIAAPARWQKTTIQRGDTLGRLAAAHRTAVDQIMRANCLPSDVIIAGAQLWLPPLPPTPTPTIPPANLLVDGVWLNGQPTAGSDAIIVPVAFALSNVGGRSADYGTVNLSYSVAGNSERIPVRFNSAVAPAVIEAGQQVPAVGGTVAFAPKLSNQMVTLWVSAHSEQSVPVNLSLPSPVVRIDTIGAGGGGMAALLYNEGTEQWYTEMTLTGHIDNEAAFQVQAWEWRNGGTVIGNGPTVTLQLASQTTCIPYDITLQVTVAYFGGAYTMSESAAVRSACASD